MRPSLRAFVASLGILAAAGGCTLDRGIGPAEQQRLFVGPRTVACQAWYGPIECLQVRQGANGAWQSWFQGIEGFTWEVGYVHEIIVDVFRLTGEIPADGSDRIYQLRRVVSKVPAAPGLVWRQ